MMYSAYEANAAFTRPFRAWAQIMAPWLSKPPLSKLGLGIPDTAADEVPPFRRVGAALDLLASAGIRHERPAFDIDTVQSGNLQVAVTEQVVHRTPFATLLRFAKDMAQEQPKVLVVAPMSGHFATLLRGTVRTLLADHDVYITDWHNGRDIPLRHGAFDFDDFVAHVMDFLRVMGPGSHVLAVCQPTVPVLAAVALMAQDRDPAQPRSMVLMAGPVDTRLHPTKVNELATSKPIEWFDRNLISHVPPPSLGAGRRVYPGFIQLTAFMAMNIERHRRAFAAQYDNLIEGRAEKAAAHRAFYDEYMAVMDLPAEFYLQTIRRVFQDADLAQGRLMWRGLKVEPRAIRRTALLTVEGELDDICATGQTMAALDLCVGLRPSMRRHHLQTGVGHYGVFNGRRWAGEIYPRVRALIGAHSH